MDAQSAGGAEDEPAPGPEDGKTPTDEAPNDDGVSTDDAEVAADDDAVAELEEAMAEDGAAEPARDSALDASDTADMDDDDNGDDEDVPAGTPASPVDSATGGVQEAAKARTARGHARVFMAQR